MTHTPDHYDPRAQPAPGAPAVAYRVLSREYPVSGCLGCGAVVWDADRHTATCPAAPKEPRWMKEALTALAERQAALGQRSAD